MKTAPRRDDQRQRCCRRSTTGAQSAVERSQVDRRQGRSIPSSTRTPAVRRGADRGDQRRQRGERLQQKAGDKSALGRVKFEFDNRFGVYLHDTPAKAALEPGLAPGQPWLRAPGEPRAASPPPLLGDQPAWTPQTIDAAIDVGDTKRVAVDHPVGVFLFYWTAFVGADGRMNFLSDPYDWDRSLLGTHGRSFRDRIPATLDLQ